MWGGNGCLPVARASPSRAIWGKRVKATSAHAFLESLPRSLLRAAVHADMSSGSLNSAPQRATAFALLGMVLLLSQLPCSSFRFFESTGAALKSLLLIAVPENELPALPT